MPRTLPILLPAFLSACSPSESRHDALPEEREILELRPNGSFVAALDHGLARIDARSGRVLSRTAAGEIDDLLVVGERVLTFEIEPREEGGALFARPLDLSSTFALGSSAGVVRLGALGPSIIVFEEADGARWREPDGPRSWWSPAPRSIFGSDTTLRALTRADGAFAIRSLRVVKGQPVVDVEPAPAFRSEDPRVVPVGSALVPVEVVEKTLRVGDVDTGLPARDVVDVVSLGGSLAVLTATPTRLVVGKPSGPFLSRELEGEPRYDPRRLSRSLVVVSPRRILVATTRRVVAVGVEVGSLVLDSGFAPHGAHAPIAGLFPG